MHLRADPFFICSIPAISEASNQLQSALTLCHNQQTYLRDFEYISTVLSRELRLKYYNDEYLLHFIYFISTLFSDI